MAVVPDRIRSPKDTSGPNLPFPSTVADMGRIRKFEGSGVPRYPANHTPSIDPCSSGYLLLPSAPREVQRSGRSLAFRLTSQQEKIQRLVARGEKAAADVVVVVAAVAAVIEDIAVAAVSIVVAAVVEDVVVVVVVVVVVPAVVVAVAVAAASSRAGFAAVRPVQPTRLAVVLAVGEGIFAAAFDD